MRGERDSSLAASPALPVLPLASFFSLASNVGSGGAATAKAAVPRTWATTSAAVVSGAVASAESDGAWAHSLPSIPVAGTSAAVAGVTSDEEADAAVAVARIAGVADCCAGSIARSPPTGLGGGGGGGGGGGCGGGKPALARAVATSAVPGEVAATSVAEAEGMRADAYACELVVDGPADVPAGCPLALQPRGGGVSCSTGGGIGG